VVYALIAEDLRSAGTGSGSRPARRWAELAPELEAVGARAVRLYRDDDLVVRLLG
jgi:hypothetical protein